MIVPLYQYYKQRQQLLTPTSVSATGIRNTISISWQSSAVDHEIRLGEQEGVYTITRQTMGNSIVVGGLKYSTGYFIQVRAVNLEGQSEWSQAISAGTEAQQQAGEDSFFSVDKRSIASKSDYSPNADRAALLSGFDWGRIRSNRLKSIHAADWNLITQKAQSNSTAEILAKAFYAFIVNDASIGRDAINRAFSWVDSINDYEKSKDALNILSQALLVYQACGAFFDGSTPSKTQFRTKCKEKFSEIPGNDIDARQADSHIAGHQATGFLQAGLMAACFYDDEPEIFNNYLDALYDNRGLEAQNYFLQSGAYHQGTYGGKQSHYYLLQMQFQQFLPSNLTFLDDQLRNLAYSNIFGHCTDGVMLVDAETNDQHWGHGHGEYRHVALAFLLYGDPYFLYFLENNSFNNPLAGLTQEEPVETLIALGKILHEVSPRNLSQGVPLVWQATNPLGRYIWQNNHAMVGNQSKVDFKYNLLSTEAHDDRADGRFQIVVNGKRLIKIGGVWSGVFNKHSRPWLRGASGAGGIVLYDSSEDWLNTSNGTSSNHLNTGGIRSNSDVDAQADYLNDIEDTGKGWEYGDLKGFLLDDEINPSIISAHLDLTEGYRNDGLDRGIYNDRANHASRIVATFPDAFGYQAIVVVIDRVEPTSAVDDFHIRIPVHGYSVDNNRVRVSRDGEHCDVYGVLPSNMEVQTSTGFSYQGQDMSPDSGAESNSDEGNGEVIRWQATSNYAGVLHRIATYITLSGSSVDESAFVTNTSADSWWVSHPTLRCQIVTSLDNNPRTSCDFTVHYANTNLLIVDLEPGKYTLDGQEYTIQEGQNQLFVASMSAGAKTLSQGVIGPAQGYIQPVNFDYFIGWDFQGKRGVEYDKGITTDDGLRMNHEFFRNIDVITQDDDPEVVGSLNGFVTRHQVKQYRDGNGNLSGGTRNSNTQNHSRSEIQMFVPPSTPNASTLYGRVAGDRSWPRYANMFTNYVYQWRMKLTTWSEKATSSVYHGAPPIHPTLAEDYDCSLVDLKQDGAGRSRDATFRIRLIGDYLNFVQNIHADYGMDYNVPGNPHTGIRTKIHYPQIWDNDWHTFTLDVRWGNDATCYLNLYIDGVLLYQHTGLNVFWDDFNRAPYFKVGPYSAAYRFGHDVGSEQREVFIDYVVFGIKNSNGLGWTKYSQA